jgi:hypothetical protein
MDWQQIISLLIVFLSTAFVVRRLTQKSLRTDARLCYGCRYASHPRANPPDGSQHAATLQTADRGQA